MKQLKLTGLSAIALAFVIGFATSCKKADLEDWQSATDQATSESIGSDADEVIDNAAESAFSFKGGPKGGFDETMAICGTVSVDSTSAGLGTTTFGGRKFPRKVTIDYGTSTTCGTGTLRARTFSGKTMVEINKPLRESGSVAVQTFDNFKINDNKLEGTRTRSNITPAGGRHTVKIEMANGKITDTNSKTFTWNSTRTRTFTAGDDTRTDRNDDEWDITGNASGVNRNGDAFTANITNAIHMTFACRFPTRGTVVVTRTGAQDRSIDFGSGACDGKATVTVGTTTREISLPGRR